jgi:hypothetical protein
MKVGTIVEMPPPGAQFSADTQLMQAAEALNCFLPMEQAQGHMFGVMVAQPERNILYQPRNNKEVYYGQ